jgi:large subunit ribosomal protein L31
MKAGIHPKYVLATVTCACGNTWQTMSTKDVLKTDLCSKCHPFFTGEQRIVDTAGQVERFMRRMGNRTQVAQPVQAARRGSKNKANIAPPPQERRRPVETEGEGAEGAEGELETADTVEAAETAEV